MRLRRLEQLANIQQCQHTEQCEYRRGNCVNQRHAHLLRDGEAPITRPTSNGTVRPELNFLGIRRWGHHEGLLPFSVERFARSVTFCERPDQDVQVHQSWAYGLPANSLSGERIRGDQPNCCRSRIRVLNARVAPGTAAERQTCRAGRNHCAVEGRHRCGAADQDAELNRGREGHRSDSLRISGLLRRNRTAYNRARVHLSEVPTVDCSPSRFSFEVRLTSGTAD